MITTGTHRPWAGRCTVFLTGAAMLATVLALAPGPARAANVPAASSTRHRAMAQPALTTDTNAPCNAPVPTGYVRCMAVVRTPADHQITADQSGPPSTALTPADIQAAYKLPSGGQGQTVAIVDAYGDPQAAADLAVFRTQYGLPPCTAASGCFTQVNQDGDTSLPPPKGWGLETSLDIEAVSAACPACHILLVESNNASFKNIGTAVDEAVALGAKFISNSYGVDGEVYGETHYDHFFDHPGVEITFASGDSGYTGQAWPATNPDVTAAGGTTLVRDPGVPRGWAESAWVAGGSGCSLYEPRPVYQQNLVTDCGMRAVADVAADADPASALAVYDTDAPGHPGSSGTVGWFQVGGTSLATPLITAFDGPLVFTGAMRGASTPGSDGPANLLAAIRFAACPQARGLGSVVVANDQIHASRFVRKEHATSTATFGSPLAGPLGYVTEDRVRIQLRPPGRLHVPAAPDAAIPRIAQLTTFFDIDIDLLNAVTSLGYEGLVLAAFGAGHVPSWVVPALEKLAQQIPVVISSRTNCGEVLAGSYAYPGSETDLISRGMLRAVSLDPAHATVLLRLLLMAGIARDRLAWCFEQATSAEGITTVSASWVAND